MKQQIGSVGIQTTTRATDTGCDMIPANGPFGNRTIGPRTVIVPADPIIWDNGTSYEYLTLVASEDFGQGYVSKKDVPAGTPLTNSDYWIPVANFNAQLAAILKALARAGRVYETVAAMKADDVDSGKGCMTLGYSAANDGGSMLYSVVADSSDPMAIELANGNKAVPVTGVEVRPEQFGYDGSADISPFIEYAVKRNKHIVLTSGKTYAAGHIDLGTEVHELHIEGNGATLDNFSIRMGLTSTFEWSQPYSVYWCYVHGVRFTYNTRTGNYSTFEGAVFPVFSHCYFVNASGILTLPYHAYLDEVYMEYINIQLNGYTPTRDMITSFNSDGTYGNVYRGDNWVFNHIHMASGRPDPHYFLTAGNYQNNIIFNNCMNLGVNFQNRIGVCTVTNGHYERTTFNMVQNAQVVFDKCYIDIHCTLPYSPLTRLVNCQFGYANYPSKENAQTLELNSYLMNGQIIGCIEDGGRDVIGSDMSVSLLIGNAPTPACAVGSAKHDTATHNTAGAYSYYVFPSVSKDVVCCPYRDKLDVTLQNTDIYEIQVQDPYKHMFKHVYRQGNGQTVKIVVPPTVSNLFDYGDTCNLLFRWSAAELPSSLTISPYSVANGGNYLQCRGALVAPVPDGYAAVVKD